VATGTDITTGTIATMAIGVRTAIATARVITAMATGAMLTTVTGVVVADIAIMTAIQTAATGPAVINGMTTSTVTAGKERAWWTPATGAPEHATGMQQATGRPGTWQQPIKGSKPIAV
jgi:hypothetical protein